MRSMWGTHLEDEETWGSLCVDACNVFNEGDWEMIVWVEVHLWSSGVRFFSPCIGIIRY